MGQTKTSKTKTNKAAVFFERGSWYHRTKSINEDFTIRYGKKGGFATAEEAEQNYWEERETFEREIAQYKLCKPQTADCRWLIDSYTIH